MRGMPFNLQGNGVLQVLEGGAQAAQEEEGSSFLGVTTCLDITTTTPTNNNKNIKHKGFTGFEPRSVLDRSPSPPTSSSTLSSSAAGASSDTTNLHHHPPPAADTNKWSIPSGTTTPSSATAKDNWASELQPIPSSLDMGSDKGTTGMDDWEAMVSVPPAGSAQEQTFLQWIMADAEESMKQHHLLSQPPLMDFDGSSGLGFGLLDSGFGFESIGGGIGGVAPVVVSPSTLASGGGFPPMGSIKVPTFGNPPHNPIFPPATSLPSPLPLPPGVLFQESMDENQLLFAPGLVLNQPQLQPNPPFFLPQQQQQQLLLPPHQKRHHIAIVEPTCQIPPKLPSPDIFLRRNQPQQQQPFPPMNPAVPYHLHHRPTKPKATSIDAESAPEAQHQALVDQLSKSAELIEVGNPVSAHGILARLNQQLPSPIGKPLLRSAFYFKEALQLITSNPSSSPSHHRHPPSAATPLDVFLKLGTYKAFSEVSPLLQFTNFTCIQAILEELGGSDRIHILDFDIGVGGQWSSFMQELAQRHCLSGGKTPLLKITAFTSTFSHHPLELHLTCESLSRFAADLSIPFEFNVMNLDNFDNSMLLKLCSGVEEALAVNLPVSSAYHPPVATLLGLVKQLSPKIVVSVDHGCDRSDLLFSHQLLHALQSCTALLDSIDAAGTNSDVSNKIERFMLQPRIETALLGRYHAGAQKMVPWRKLFASAGFIPVQFSNFNETQAECLLKRVQVRGFHVEKRHASLFLCWQCGELISVSAWRC